MNDSEAIEAVAYLTAMTNGWDDDLALMYVGELGKLDNGATLMEACQRVARTWTFGNRPPLGVVFKLYGEVEAEQVQRVRREFAAPSNVRCEGSGWLPIADRRGGDITPCPSCSPALSRVWADDESHARWRNGEQLWVILGADNPADFRKAYGRPSCLPGHVEDEHAISPQEGIEAARTAYAAECVADDRIPNWAYFDSIFSGVMARALATD
jgi:hypothetical protein